MLILPMHLVINIIMFVLISNVRLLIIVTWILIHIVILQFRMLEMLHIVKWVRKFVLLKAFASL